MSTVRIGADPDSVARQENGRVHVVFVHEPNVAEVLLAEAERGDLAAPLEHLRDDVLGDVLREAADEHGAAARRPLARGRGRRARVRREERAGLAVDYLFGRAGWDQRRWVLGIVQVLATVLPLSLNCYY